MNTEQALEKLSKYQADIAVSVGDLAKIISSILERVEKLEKNAEGVNQ